MRIESWIKPLALAAALLAPGATLAVETGDITLTEGYVDPQSGVRVDKVVKDPQSGLETITLSVPRKYGEIDEIIVRGRREREELKQRRKYEKVNDPARDYYGYVVYLGERQDVPVRLYMDARQQEPGAITPP